MSKSFRYVRVQKEIRRRIESGDYAIGQRLESTDQLAEEFRTSRITVNHALTNLSQDGFITRTPGKGSTVNPKSKWLRDTARSETAKMVGAIVFDSSSPYLWATAVRGMEDGLNEEGYHLVIGNDDGSIDRALQYITQLGQKGIAGYIFVPIGQRTKDEYYTRNAELVAALEKYRLPYLMFHRFLENASCPIVALENYRDTVKLTERLLETGVSNPLCLSHYYDSVVDERERAFCDVLAKAGISSPPDRIHRVLPVGQRVTRESANQIRTALLADPATDGVLTISGDLLQTALAVINAEGGGTVARFRFASYDYSELLYDHPAVQVMMDTPSHDLGRLAAQTVLHSLGETRTVPARTLLASALVDKTLER